ncbi:MAG: hypothetical protein H7268_08830 [Sandarakinorhabdus sp.]|nr:hypothetical protein [Sandarakinorhabdus sp.]
MTPTLFEIALFMVLAATAPPVSICAALAEAGRVGAAGRDRVAPAVPNADRTLRCPDDFRIDNLARPPRCVAPGIKAVDGNPRAACLAGLPLGPMAPLPVRNRPTRSCDTGKFTTIIRLSGTNIGLADAALAIVPDTGITATTLFASADDVPEGEDPVVQGCFGYDCRLVKLVITPRAAPIVRVQIALPGRDPVEQLLKLPEYCPH